MDKEGNWRREKKLEHDKIRTVSSGFPVSLLPPIKSVACRVSVKFTVDENV